MNPRSGIAPASTLSNGIRQVVGAPATALADDARRTAPTGICGVTGAVA